MGTEAVCSHFGAAPRVATGPLHVEEALVILAYVGTILLLVAGPLHLPLPRRYRWSHPPWWLEKTVYAPLCGIIYLALVNFFRGKTTSLISSADVLQVLVAKVPIVVLILSFAYLSISLDTSGFFQECANFIVVAAKGSGLRLLIYLYGLCSLLTYFTSNDIVIISMTPIIIHVGVFAGVKNVIPLLVTQFIAANTSSMGMYVGSPTNIILGDAVQLTFLSYWYLMMLPTVVSVLATLGMVFVVFVWAPSRGNVMQRSFTPVSPSANSPTTHALRSPRLTPPIEQQRYNGTPQRTQLSSGGASSGSGWVEMPEGDAVTFAAITGVPVPADPLSSSGRRHVEDGHGTSPATSRDVEMIEEVAEAEDGAAVDETAFVASTTMLSNRTRWVKVAVFAVVLVLCSISDLIGLKLWLVSLISALGMLVLDIAIVHKDRGSLWSFLTKITNRMPWSIGPFVVCMFLLVRVLTDTGFTGRFSGWMVDAAGEGVFRQTLTFGYVSALLVNWFNDLPSTVFWADLVPLLCKAYPKANYTAVVMALLVGVNPGCYLTIIGALAGLMWRTIIRTQPGSDKLIVPTAIDLTYYGAMVLGPVMLLTVRMSDWPFVLHVYLRFRLVQMSALLSS